MRRAVSYVSLLGIVIVVIALTVSSSSCGGRCRIECNDGTCSNAENTQGACSYHGGIKKAQNLSPTAPE